MAISEATGGWTDGGLSCYFHDAHATTHSYLDATSWGRDTGNCEQALIGVTMNSMLHYDSLVWASSGNFGGNYIKVWSNLTTRQNGEAGLPKGCNSCASGQGCCCCNCSGWDCYWHNTYGHWNTNVYTNKNTTALYHQSAFLNNWTGTGTYNLPDDRKILPPTGLSATWPSNWSGSISATITNWSSNSNIGGTPTTYPNAKIWNFAIELLNSSGTKLAHQLFKTGETKSVSTADLKNGWYTANALVGSSAASSSKYTLQGGQTYKFRVIANNNMNQQQSTTSGNFVYDIPTPTVQIDSFLYDKTAKSNQLTFTWSKAESALAEKITYTVQQNGVTVASGTLVENTNGAAKSGTTTVTGIPTGEYTTVTVINAARDGSQTKSKSVSDYSPVAAAAFLGFDWDDVRRVCTIRAEAPGAANCRIQAGYAANTYDIGNQLTPGEVGTLVVSELNHGSGQVMYLQAVPEATNGHQFINEIAKISVPIPNPILGVRTGTDKKQYIVDIIEHKAGGTVTPKWKNGDRIVKKV